MLNDEQKQLIQKGAKAFTTMFIALGCLLVTVAIGIISKQIDFEGKWLTGRFNGGVGIAIIAGVFFIIFIVSFAIYNSSKSAPELEYLPGNGLDEPVKLTKLASQNGLKKFSLIPALICLVLFVPVMVCAVYVDRKEEVTNALLNNGFSEEDIAELEDYYDADIEEILSDDFHYEQLANDPDATIYENDDIIELEEKLEDEGFVVYNSLGSPDSEPTLYVATSEELLFEEDVMICFSRYELLNVSISYKGDASLSDEENFKNANKAFEKLEPVFELLCEDKYINTDAVMNYLSFPDEFVNQCTESGEDKENLFVSILETTNEFDEVMYTKHVWDEKEVSLSIDFWECY